MCFSNIFVQCIYQMEHTYLYNVVSLFSESAFKTLRSALYSLLKNILGSQLWCKDKVNIRRHEYKTLIIFSYYFEESKIILHNRDIVIKKLFTNNAVI